MLPMLIVLAAVLAVPFVAPVAPPLTSPAELVEYTKGDPAKIAEWVGLAITHEYTPRWEAAETCMTRRSGDCKCYAIVARDALLMTGNYEANLVIIYNPQRFAATGKKHAVAIYTDLHTGERGVLNYGRRYAFSAGTPWAELMAAVPGGPWEIEE